MTDGKVLMKDGVWCVPPAERPRNWRQLPVREVASTAPVIEQPVESAPVAAPVTTKPSTALETAIQNTEKAQNASPSRAKKAAASAKRFRELRKNIAEFHLGEWAKEMADNREAPVLARAAQVLILGIWTRDPKELSHVIRCPVAEVRRFSTRCISQGLWHDEGLVTICTDDEELGDIEFLLNVMAVAGMIERCGDGLFRAAA